MTLFSKPKYIRLILAVTILVACLPILQAGAQSQPQFVDSVDHYSFYDANFNVAQRLRTEAKRERNILANREGSEPVKVLIFVAELSKLKRSAYFSKFASAIDLEAVTDGHGRLYIPCLESDKVGARILRAKLGKPVREAFGRKVLSRTTHYVEPLDGKIGFFAKFAPHTPGFEQRNEREVLINDYVHSQIDQLPIEMRNLAMDSFLTVNLSAFGIPFSVAYRSAKNISNKPENIRTFPGHGLFGCDECVAEFAKKWSGLSDEKKAVAKWKTEEYLPKLAKYTAYTHHVLGVSFEAHTQNMVLDVNADTGAIEEFYFRDFADVLLNPIPLIADGRFPDQIDWKRVRLMAIHPNYFVDEHTRIAKDIWYHASIYSGQGITSHIKGFPRQQRYLSKFLKDYIAETEKIIGKPIVLSIEAQATLNNLDNRAEKEEFTKGELNERSPLRNAMATILKSVFEQVHEVKVAKINADLKTAIEERSQPKLRRAFFKALIAQRVVYMGVDQRRQLIGEDTKYTWLKATLGAYLRLGLAPRTSQTGDIEFKVYNDHLYAIDSKTQSVLAATVDTHVDKTGWIENLTGWFKRPSENDSKPKTIPPVGGQICEGFFG